MKTNTSITALLLTLCASQAMGHGEEEFDVYLARPTTGSQTFSGGINVDGIDSEIFPGLRVFGTELGENPLDGVYFGDEPGFNNQGTAGPQAPGALPLNPGDTFSVAELPFLLDGQVSDLFFWDGTGAPSFSPAAGVDFVIGDPSESANANGAFDDHPILTLDDLDNNAGTFPTPGIYLSSFSAALPGLAPTDSLFLVMGTEGLVTADFLDITQGEFDLLSDEEIDEALEEVIETGVDFVTTNVVPEPASALLLVAALASFVGRGRNAACRD